MSVKKLLVHVPFYIWFISKTEFLSKIIEIISFLVSLLCTGQIAMNPRTFYQVLGTQVPRTPMDITFFCSLAFLLPYFYLAPT